MKIKSFYFTFTAHNWIIKLFLQATDNNECTDSELNRAGSTLTKNYKIYITVLKSRPAGVTSK